MTNNDLYNSRNGVFDYLATTSGVKFSTSATIDGFVHKNYVVVHDAPPVVVKFILANFKHVSLREGLGLLIQTGPSV
jgi:hypothetical protein